MLTYLLGRIGQNLVLLVLVSIIGFAVLHLAPGGPLAQFALVPGMSQADIARIAAQMGLDRPLPVQYWDWFSHLLRGDWGRSYRDSAARAQRHRLAPVRHARADDHRHPDRRSCSASGSASWVPSAAIRRSTTSRTIGAMVALSIPTFWFGLVVIYVFSVKLGWVPSGNMYTIGDGSLLDFLHHLIAPSLVLALVEVAVWSRYMRASMLDVINQDLHPHRARQGPARAGRAAAPRAAQRADADDHARGHAAADAAGRRAGHRDRLHLAGHGPPVPRFPGLPRLSGGDGHPDVLGRCSCSSATCWRTCSALSPIRASGWIETAMQRRRQPFRASRLPCRRATGRCRRFCRHRLAVFGLLVDRPADPGLGGRPVADPLRRAAHRHPQPLRRRRSPARTSWAPTSSAATSPRAC